MTLQEIISWAMGQNVFVLFSYAVLVFIGGCFLYALLSAFFE